MKNLEVTRSRNMEYKTVRNKLQYISFIDEYIAVIIDDNVEDHLILKKSTFNIINHLPVNIFFKDNTYNYTDKSYEEWLKENNVKDKRNEDYKMWYRRKVKSLNYIRQ